MQPWDLTPRLGPTALGYPALVQFCVKTLPVVSWGGWHRAGLQCLSLLKGHSHPAGMAREQPRPAQHHTWAHDISVQVPSPAATGARSAAVPGGRGMPGDAGSCHAAQRTPPRPGSEKAGPCGKGSESDWERDSFPRQRACQLLRLVWRPDQLLFGVSHWAGRCDLWLGLTGLKCICDAF